MEKIKKSFLLLLSAMVLASCGNKSFTIEGQVADAEGDTLFVEQMQLYKIVPLDSQKIAKTGNFKFKIPAPQFPDFYRLRLGEKTLVLAVDSCENIKILTSKNGFSTNFTVENSPNTEKIRQLRLSSFELQKNISSVSSDELTEKIEVHKQLARQIILENPASTAAYYAVNQTVGGNYFFSPHEKNDLAYWAAVATAFKLNFPTYNRTKFLENSVLAVKQLNRNQVAAAEFDQLVAAAEKVGSIDVQLPDNEGNTVSLASQKGKVVLLDFALLNVPNSSERILALRELYNRFENQRFTIFQVAFDSNKLAWQEKTQHLPWISVRDEQLLNSNYLNLYNLSSLPTSFLLDKNGDIVARFTSLDGVEEKVGELLR